MVDRMRPLCLLVGVESAVETLLVGIVIGTESESVMEGGSEMTGTGVRRYLGGSRLLREYHGVTGIGRGGTGGHSPGLVLGLVLGRVRRQRADGDKKKTVYLKFMSRTVK